MVLFCRRGKGNVGGDARIEPHGLAGIELLVVGCGARVAFVPPAWRAAFKARGVSLEVVDTGSACRIYNVLLAEGRRVAAALIPL